MQTNSIEQTSYLWCKLFTENKLPVNGIVIEVAPGHEPKIGNALRLLGFYGTVFLIEPDRKAAHYIQNIYQQILPQAIIETIIKPLQKVTVGIDIPRGADALVASHPFDDMVIASIIGKTSLFSQEKEKREDMTRSIKKLYNALKDTDYTRGIKTTIAAWEHFIEKSKPDYFIASQYPSRTLIAKGLIKRQNSGYMVLEQLKNLYKNSLMQQRREYSFGYKGNPRWWIAAKKPYQKLDFNLERKPIAIKRLGKTIFIPQQARRLRPKEYDIAYINNAYFEDIKHDTLRQQIKNLAIVLDNKNPFSQSTLITYADKQKDKTKIGLGANRGSGRAVYYGDRFNILGVGKTSLCKSTIPSHSTGKLELIGAMRRIILSSWINRFTQRAPAHLALIVLKETAKFKWNPNPVPLCLLVREDGGSLDRPSHVEQSPNIPVNFQQTITEYARLDSEYFAYRIMLGAWSTSNYSLTGHMIDLESASFVKYRGPYYTSTSKYSYNRFGYEGFGFLKILYQLANIKNIRNKEIENRFYKEQRQHLGRCFLSLLGIADISASVFFSKYQNRILNLSDQFKKLAQKINTPKTDLNLYMPIPDDKDPSLLDMSNLFKNLANLYKSANAETKAFEYLIRKSALLQIKTGAIHASLNRVEALIWNRAVIPRNQLSHFLQETKNFIHELFQLLASLDTEKCLNTKKNWNDRLQIINKNVPTMFELNMTLRSLAESYRLKKINPQTLGSEINKLCELPTK